MKIRFFYADNCHFCETVKSIITKWSIQIELVDALSDETQELCDRYNVDALPHIQVIKDDGSLIADFGVVKDGNMVSALENYLNS